jgi:hypothetical protein
VAPQAAADEPQATPKAETSTECISDKEKAARLEKLLENRKAAFRRYEDRKSIPSFLDTAGIVTGALGVGGAGIALSGGVSSNSALLIAGAGCSACALTTQLTIAIVNSAFFDHRAEDIAALEKAQVEFNEEAMKF